MTNLFAIEKVYWVTHFLGVLHVALLNGLIKLEKCIQKGGSFLVVYTLSKCQEIKERPKSRKMKHVCRYRYIYSRYKRYVYVIFLADCAFACDEERVKCLQPPDTPSHPAPFGHSPYFRTIVPLFVFFLYFPNEMQLENVKKGQTVAAKGKLQ